MEKKTALNLLEKYGSVENVYKNIEEITGKLKEKLIIGKESCEISYKLATIKTDCEIEINLNNFIYDFPFKNKVKTLFEKYEFKSLLKRENIFINADNDADEIKNDVEFTKINFEELKSNLIDFKSDFFSIHFGATLRISTSKMNLEIDPLEYINTDFNECIKLALNDVFADETVLKIFNDCKEFMKKISCNNINNYHDLSVAQYLINGGRRADDFEDVTQYYNIYISQLKKLDEMDMKQLYFNIELPLVKVLYDMEKTGFNIDKEALNDLYNTYSKQLKELEDSILEYSEDKKININSPKQIAEYLFDTLKITDKGNKKHSTKESSLLAIIDQHPVIEKILKYRKVSKVFSTYVEPYTKLTEKTSLIHTVFNQTQTSTGRLSSSEPNLQNIPIRNDEHKNLRKIFISRFNGGFIMSADYNQIELRLLANFSNDESLINDYKRGKDIHSVTASQIFDVNLDDVTANQRRMAKAVNFGIIYGISGFGLSKNVDISVAEAFKYINMYFVKYPKVKQYLDGLIDFAKLNGYSKTLFNRIRNIPELKSTNGLQRQLGERVAMNMPLQGSASDIIKLAMIKVQQKLVEMNLNSKLILQIHDELVVDVFPGEEQIVKQILASEMESVYDFKVPLLVDVNYGKTYLDCK